MIWRCPNCHAPLHSHENSWRCTSGHSFDVAKQGYANLLLPNQKASRDPGDSQAMIQSRRRFLQAGFYLPLARAIAETFLNHRQANVRLLDIGCGEGYYLRELASLFRESGVERCEFFGLDISREAVKRAATALPTGSFCVASSYRVPAQDQCVNAVLQVFAPADDQEVRRVLSEEGVWLRVVPGPRHLFQIKQALYQQVREHETPEVPAGFRLADQREVNFPLQLNSAEAIADLLAMTPLAWHGSTEGKQQLQGRDTLEVEADFVLQLLAPNADASL